MSDTIQEDKKPFTKAFVLRTTAKHMRKSIDISIRKTFERHAELVDTDKAVEVFETLGILHKMRAELDDFQSQNSKHFSEK